MSEYHRSSSRSRGQNESNDEPPMSRLFIICNKSHTEEDFRKQFSPYGEIEDVWVVKDKHTNENKGIAYVKFSKTSDAARAQEEMNGKCLGDTDRTIKVLVAANRNQGARKSENEQEKYVRLFIVVAKTATEDEVLEEFTKFGDVESVTLVKDRSSGQSKGFGYVKYKRFYHAAIAYESCASKYRAVFAEPKADRGRNAPNSDNSNFNNRDEGYNNSYNPRNGASGNNYGGGPGFGMSGGGGSGGSYGNNFNDNNYGSNSEIDAFLRMQQSNASLKQPTSLEVICSSSVNQDQLWRLFDIIPGLDYCQFTRERTVRTSEASVVYDNPESAIYAKEKIHGLEYPPGERLIVKLVGLDNARLENLGGIDRRLRRESLCNVDLPPAAPFADLNDPVARRCFIVLSSGLPITILKNVFCCFGGLIDVYLLPNKNCGYVKYANADSAERAIETLNGCEICGVRVKVMKAEEPGEENRKRMRRE